MTFPGRRFSSCEASTPRSSRAVSLGFSALAFSLAGCNGGGASFGALNNPGNVTAQSNAARGDHSARNSPAGGNIYAQTNAAGGNAIVQYRRGSDGSLTYIGMTSTGGNGIGSVNVVNGKRSIDPLFSSDSLLLTSDHSRLFAVNAGSNTIASFVVSPSGSLRFVGSYPTGGNIPTTLAVHNNLLYVGHAKPNAANVQLVGFTINANGSLTAIAGARYRSSGATVVAQVVFSPDGSLLEMSELQTNKIDLYPVKADGRLGTPVVNTSVGTSPFGAAFVNTSRLIVAEAGPGAVSSYSLAPNGFLSPISPSLANGQSATCWVRISPNGRFVFAANAGSGDVSTYALGSGASLRLLSRAQAARPGAGAVGFMGGATTSGPVDAVFSADTKYYYQQYSGLGLVAGYVVNTNGTLTALPNALGTHLPTVGAEGVAGY
jgi:6-phosphogluconolactonase